MARFLPLLKVLCVEQTVNGAKRDKGLTGIWKRYLGNFTYKSEEVKMNSIFKGITQAETLTRLLRKRKEKMVCD
jgi:hypothetical protein